MKFINNLGKPFQKERFACKIDSTQSNWWRRTMATPRIEMKGER